MKYIVSIFLFLEFFFVPNLAYGFDWENDFDKRNQTNNFLFELTDLSAALDACGEYDLSIRALNIANETIEVLFKQDIINTNINVTSVNLKLNLSNVNPINKFVIIIANKKLPKTPAYVLLGLSLVNFGPLRSLPKM